MTALTQALQNFQSTTLSLRAAQGAAVAFTIVAMYVTACIVWDYVDFGVWAYMPMITVAIGGAFAGVFFYLMDFVRAYGGWMKVAANIASVLAFIFCLWVSFVAGMAAVGFWH